jgi:hypothetical protein
MAAHSHGRRAATAVDYFADVLVRVGAHPASRVEQLLPENWARLFAKKPAVEAASV